MIETVREVIVVGGGISGLTTAWHLRRAGVDVCLFEAGETVGGCTRTERRDGFLLEKGPFNVMVRDPAFEELLVEFSEELEVVRASRAARARFIYLRGRLRRVPTNPISLATSGLLSPWGKLRLMTGLLASARAGTEEETIAQAAARRFGRQVADNMVSAVIAGIFAGDANRLSARACFPAVARVDAEVRSLIGYALGMPFGLKRAKKEKRERRWRGLVSIDGGLGALTSAIGGKLGDGLVSGCRVESVRAVDGGYEVVYNNGDGPTRRLMCRQLVIAAGASAAGTLLGRMVSHMAPELETMPSASLAVLNLGYRRADVGHPMEGFGFLVPDSEPGFPLMGVLWADSIFPRHAPADHRLLRVFVGGSRDPEAVTRSDEELLSTATDALGDLLELSGDPVMVDICRHEAAIPQYHIGHGERMERVRAAVGGLPGLHLVGNYLEGVSLNDCVRLAKRVAGEVVANRAAANAPARPVELCSEPRA